MASYVTKFLANIIMIIKNNNQSTMLLNWKFSPAIFFVYFLQKFVKPGSWIFEMFQLCFTLVLSNFAADLNGKLCGYIFTNNIYDYAKQYTQHFVIKKECSNLRYFSLVFGSICKKIAKPEQQNFLGFPVTCHRPYYKIFVAVFYNKLACFTLKWSLTFVDKSTSLPSNVLHSGVPGSLPRFTQKHKTWM